MISDIAPAETDDKHFIQLTFQIVRTIVHSVQPNDCYVLKLDNWFDSKWLLWPGQRPWAEGTIHERTPLPCFNPSRIVNQLHYVRTTPPDEYRLSPETELIHAYDGAYPRKVHRWLTDFSRSGVFCWFSGNTTPNGQGSLMTYIYTPDVSSAWYASFQKNDEWAIKRCHAISRRELEVLIGKTPMSKPKPRTVLP